MPAAITISLTDGERWQLQHLRDGAQNAGLVRKSQVVLMTADGKSVTEVRDATGFDEVTIWKWRKRYVEGGIQGLYDRRPRGRPPKADGPYLNQLRRAVRRSPRKLGYAFSVWSGGRLAEHLAEKTGVQLTGDWVLWLLKHRLGFSYQRPKHTLMGKRDEEEHDRGEKELAELKKGLC